jgi:hypothetical protein
MGGIRNAKPSNLLGTQAKLSTQITLAIHHLFFLAFIQPTERQTLQSTMNHM